VESALLGLAIPEGSESLSAGAHFELPGDARHAASPEERGDLLRFMVVAVYADTPTRRIVALKPKRSFAPLLSVVPSLKRQGDLFFVTDPRICQALDAIGGDDGGRLPTWRHVRRGTSIALQHNSTLAPALYDEPPAPDGHNLAAHHQTRRRTIL
jgi:hypothetical protein